MMALVERGERVARSQSEPATANRVSGALVAACPAALGCILDPDIALSIWRRCLTDGIEAQLAGLVLDEIDDILLECGLEALDGSLADAMAEAGYPNTAELRGDIVMLADQHAAITGERRVRIRLEVVETDACYRFHADYVKVRTITTYLGDGTQWIEAVSTESTGPLDRPRIKQVAAGWVAMFKGRLWQEDPAILHRSPPIGTSGKQRLVLVIDSAPVEDETTIRLEDART